MGPISLSNADYKLIEKCISRRIESVQSDVIHSDPTGFISSRYIGENINTILNILNYTEAEGWLLILHALINFIQCSSHAVNYYHGIQCIYHIVNDPSMQCVYHIVNDPSIQCIYHTVNDPSTQCIYHTVNDPSIQCIYHTVNDPSIQCIYHTVNDPSTQCIYHIVNDPSIQCIYNAVREYVVCLYM